MITVKSKKLPTALGAASLTPFAEVSFPFQTATVEIPAAKMGFQASRLAVANIFVVERARQ
jgi:hypothetical protein